ncbi:MAG TPA: GNAT family protein, partial [Caulobacter sp.]|nr:GNAT family protein [Caulobacter sp.]
MPDAPLLPCPPIDAGVLVGRTVDLERMDVARHGPALWDAIGSADDLWTWIPSGPFPTQADFAAWLEDRSARPTQTLYAVIDKTDPRGPTPAALYMALSVNPDAGTTEVGLNLGPAVTRRVGGTEAFRLLAGYIFSRGYRRLEWRCSPENVASSRAAARFGFTLEGVLRQTHWLKGVNWDTEVHAILDHEWPAVAARLDAQIDQPVAGDLV